MHPERTELAKLILVGTRITYQATGDAVWEMKCATSMWCRKVIPLLGRYNKLHFNIYSGVYNSVTSIYVPIGRFVTVSRLYDIPGAPGVGN